MFGVAFYDEVQGRSECLAGRMSRDCVQIAVYNWSVQQVI